MAHRPDERWATDLTHVWCGKDRRAALEVIIDCCTREILGWRLSDNGSAKTAEEALIERLGILQRVTQPLALRSDNGLVERFFQSLKEKCIWQHRFESLPHAQPVIGNWIRYYNEPMPHQSLDYVAPWAYPALVE